MGSLYTRLRELAEARDDLVVNEVDDIDVWGFTLFREGKYNIFINAKVRDYRKSLVMVEELAEYVYRRLDSKRGRDVAGRPATRDDLVEKRAKSNWVGRFSKRLLWYARRGLHGAPAKRPSHSGLIRKSKKIKPPAA